jgi:prepilin-type N-terminal cleavage/methylation domain-containing protein
MRCRGFSLLELSIVLIIVGLMSGVYLQFKDSAGTGDSLGATKAQLAQIDKAVLAYVAKNDRFPRPASRAAGVEDPLYGREVPLANVGTLVGVDGTGKVMFGALPFQELGLDPSFAGDAWGNKFTYAVTKELTETDATYGTKFNIPPPNDIKEAITVDTGSGTSPEKVAYAVISHGLNGLGAVKTSYRDTSATPDLRWCSAGTGIERKNCRVSDTIAAASFNDGKDAGASTFDDLITFNGKPKRAFNGQCNNSVANGCAVGIVSNPTGDATCGTVRTWTCLGTNGGTDDTSCSFTNPACLPCTQTSLTWGSGCSGPITPTPTAHGSTTSTVTNTNPSYTGTAAASCNNGVLTTTTSTCTPAPTPGVCNNAVAGGCSSGVTANDNGLTACGTTRTWHCNSTNGGTNATNCSKANAACSSCSSTSLTWGGGCVAVFPNTGHAATTPVVTNTNASYTGSATALCTDGTFATPSGPCAPVVPENGVCDNATAGACVAGDVANDNNKTACGETRTWDCNGRNGGTNASCTKTNDACGCVAGWGPETVLDADSVFVDCGGLSAAQCNAASQNACSTLFQNHINNTGGCTSGQGGNTPSTAGDINECVTYVNGSNANACQLIGRRCGSGGPGPCTADGQPSGGNPANCCSGDSDGNGTCGTQGGNCGCSGSLLGYYADETSCISGGGQCWGLAASTGTNLGCYNGPPDCSSGQPSGAEVGTCQADLVCFNGLWGGVYHSACNCDASQCASGSVKQVVTQETSGCIAAFGQIYPPDCQNGDTYNVADCSETVHCVCN